MTILADTYIKSMLICFLLLWQGIALGQTYEYVYKNPTDSSYNCYLKVIPEGKEIKGLVIRDFSSLPDTAKPTVYQFTDLCSEKRIMTLFTVSSNYFPEFFVSDSVMGVLDKLVSEVIAEHNIPKNNVFIGGISASGTRALRYTQYCEQGKSSNKIKGAFAVDSPLDLERFYYSVHKNKAHFKEGMLWEAELMTKVFKDLFGEGGEIHPEKYRLASVFSQSDPTGGNAVYLKNADLIIYHEPDIDWWLNERGSGYFDINSYDIAAFALKLRELGNENVKLVTSTNKGFDRQGKRNCHSWTIVDEVELVEWIAERMDQ